MADERKSRRCVVRGRVQGVGFRVWVRGQAARLRLDGWVRNQPDGSVAALFSGPAAAVAEMERLLHRGPPASRVAEVIAADADPPAPGFSILD